MMRSPVVRGDSLAGMVERDDATSEAVVPLADVASVSERRFAAGRTLLVVGAVFLVAIVATRAADWGPGWE